MGKKQINLGCRLENRYTITILNNEGKIKSKLQFHNVVTDWWKTNLAPWFRSGTQPSIRIGTGSGTHTAADTSLFNQIFSRQFSWSSGVLDHIGGSNSIIYKISFTLTETECNGNLTELGIFRNDSQPICIANFKDAEGQAITLEKTQYDVLTLDIELEIAADFSQLPSNVHIAVDSIYPSATGDQNWLGLFTPRYTDLSKVPTYHDRTMYLIGSGGNTVGPRPSIFGLVMGLLGNTGKMNPSPCRGINLGNLISPLNRSVTYLETTSNSTPVCRFSIANTALSSEANTFDDSLYQIMGINLNVGDTLMTIDLPDHDIFPPTELEFQMVGDGTKTDFNLPLPRLMQSRGATVTIDNVLVSSSDYDWFGKNYTMLQAWDMCDCLNVSDINVYRQYSYGGRFVTPITPYQTQLDGYAIGNDSIEYDFKQTISVDCVGKLAVGSNTASIYYKQNLTDNWTLVYTFSGSDQGIVDLPQTISARYWKIEPNTSYPITSGVNNFNIPLPVFGLKSEVTKPTIRFHSAPASGATIKIKAYTEYPCKNSDWIFDTISIDIVKAAVNPDPNP